MWSGASCSEPCSAVCSQRNISLFCLLWKCVTSCVSKIRSRPGHCAPPVRLSNLKQGLVLGEKEKGRPDIAKTQYSKNGAWNLYHLTKEPLYTATADNAGSNWAWWPGSVSLAMVVEVIVEVGHHHFHHQPSRRGAPRGPSHKPHRAPSTSYVGHQNVAHCLVDFLGVEELHHTLANVTSAGCVTVTIWRLGSFDQRRV